MPTDPKKLEAFMGQAVTDIGATMSAALALLGDRLGLYKAMAGAGSMTSGEVARAAGCAERYVREWLNGHVIGEHRRLLGRQLVGAAFRVVGDVAAGGRQPRLHAGRLGDRRRRLGRVRKAATCCGVGS